MIDRETAFQVGVAGGAVVMFVLVAIFVSSSYGENGHLSPTGGYVLVGAIGAFVVIIAAAGFWLGRLEFEAVADGSEE